MEKVFFAKQWRTIISSGDFFVQILQAKSNDVVNSKQSLTYLLDVEIGVYMCEASAYVYDNPILLVESLTIAP